MNKIKKMSKENIYLSKIYYKIRYIFYRYLISDKKLIERNYKRKLNKTINWESPILFNEKLQWLKLNWQDDLATKCADKYSVREFVEQRIGGEYLNEIYGVYNTPEEIDFESLPTKFVLKGTHGSGFNIICNDKSHFDKVNATKKMNKWLKTNYYWQNREPVYKDIEPRIIIEKFLNQEYNKDLRDYRIFCFDGSPEFISVDFNINEKSKTTRNIYNLEWEQLDVQIDYPNENKEKVDKPEKLNEMIYLSEKLSKGFPHSRIDFYYINEKIIFGEITYFHQSGNAKINPLSFEKRMGDLLKLPIKKRGV